MTNGDAPAGAAAINNAVIEIMEIRSDFKLGSYQGCFFSYRRASDAPKTQLQSAGIKGLSPRCSSENP